MKTLVILLVVCLVALMIGPGCKAATTARPKAAASKCGEACTEEWKPVCGKAEGSTVEVTFGNECVLKKVACESAKKTTKLREGECSKTAPVRLT